MSGSLRELLIAGSRELGLAISDSQANGLLLLMQELRKWNRQINLTAITGEQDILIKHILDSLTVSPHIPLNSQILDLGSGGGFPAIPLAMMRPDLKITSVDAVAKKIYFQRHMARLLELANLEMHQARGENLSERYACSFDIIISRAFSSLRDFVTMAKSLLAPDGKIIAMKGKYGGDEALAAASTLEERGLDLRELIHLHLPVSNDERYLVIIGKTEKNVYIAGKRSNLDSDEAESVAKGKPCTTGQKAGRSEI